MLLDSFRRGEREALATVHRFYVDEVATIVPRGFTIGGEGSLLAGGAPSSREKRLSALLLRELDLDIVRHVLPSSRMEVGEQRLAPADDDVGLEPPSFVALARSAAERDLGWVMDEPLWVLKSAMDGAILGASRAIRLLLGRLPELKLGALLCDRSGEAENVLMQVGVLSSVEVLAARDLLRRYLASIEGLAAPAPISAPPSASLKELRSWARKHRIQKQPRSPPGPAHDAGRERAACGGPAAPSRRRRALRAR
ncbi:MAG: hypothetical protein HY901_38160 [Deltaproteobacteria bacterium]|nr:hypothetical protein [Deltaproteobacteria bacterium]